MVENCLSPFTLWLILLTTSIGMATPGAAFTGFGESLNQLAPGDLRHRALAPKEGAPADVKSGVPTANDFLWIVTSVRLYRDDGARFDTRVRDRLKGPPARFRYRQDGFDDDWQDAGTRREALYTNLEPGRYPFRMAAANGDGVWSKKDPVPDFRPPSTFLQSLWFRLLCVALALVLLMNLYLFRVKQVCYRERLRTRCHERQRIARDIHDTLLQGVQALLFRLQDWESDPALPVALREEVGGVVTEAAAMVVEGRERILSLRGKELVPEDLINSLTAIGEGEAEGTGTAFRLRVHGRRRSLTTFAKQEIVDIGREAIRNAYMHAEATSVTVSIEYRWRTLRLEVRDNGRGIDPAVSERREAHFGLLGMCERATELRGKFSITRLSDRGTAIIVVVPAGTAYSDGFRWLSKRRPF
jgi:signal transduction histidine kinase